MLDCIQGIHDKGLVFVDVKSDNFMLSASPYSSDKKGTKKSSSSESISLSQRIRLIDFGLLESINDLSSGKHREDMHPNAPLVGTPSYTSINVMSGHTPSRRDDLEALGYVVSELILILAASSGSGKNGSSKLKGKNSGDEDDDNILPWSAAKSDDELLKMKLQEMDKSKRSKSKFFTRLKAAGTDTVMVNYFNAVQSLKYAETPDYDALRCYLKKLVVTVESSGVEAVAASASRASPKPVKNAPSRRKQTPRKYHDLDNEEVVVVDEDLDRKPSATKKPKMVVEREGVARRSGRRTNNPNAREIGTQTDEVINVDSDDDDDDAMDWEKTSADENVAPTHAAAASKSVARGKAHLKLEITDGPHKGQVVFLGGIHADTIVIGRDPSNAKASTKDADKFALEDDGTASSVHAKLILTSKKTLHSIKVTDMSSTNGTFVNGSMLGKGKSKQAFAGDRIMIGDSAFLIKKC